MIQSTGLWRFMRFLSESRKDLVRHSSTGRAALEPSDHQWGILSVSVQNRHSSCFLRFKALETSCSTAPTLDESPHDVLGHQKSNVNGQVGPERQRPPLWGHKRSIPLETSRKIWRALYLDGWSRVSVWVEVILEVDICINISLFREGNEDVGYH